MEGENKSVLWIIVGVIIVVVVAVIVVLFLQSQQATTNTDNNNPDQVADNITVDETLNEEAIFTLSEQNDSGQSGTVLLEEVGNQVRVTINLTNPTSTPEPAHIHIGSCPTPDAVVYPLTSVVNGESVTMINATFEELRSQIPLAVNVHKSVEESDVYYACGDLTLE